jgi:hypothetical protein
MNFETGNGLRARCLGHHPSEPIEVLEYRTAMSSFGTSLQFRTAPIMSLIGAKADILRTPSKRRY